MKYIATLLALALLFLISQLFVVNKNKTAESFTTESSVRRDDKLKKGNGLEEIHGVKFHWSQIESESYPQYIQNLRKIGCPEQTIRDIIVSDVNSFYAGKIRDIGFSSVKRYWLSDGDWGGLVAKKELLIKERDDLVKSLLGEFVPWVEPRYDFLSLEKGAKVVEIERNFLPLFHSITNKSGRILLPDELAALRRLEGALYSQLGQHLTEDELLNVKILNSTFVRSMSRRYVDFKPTEEEFKKMFVLRDEYKDVFSHENNILPGTLKESFDKQQEMKNKLRSELGEARYQDYLNAEDSKNYESKRLAEGYAIQSADAQKILDFKKTLGNELQKISNDPVGRRIKDELLIKSKSEMVQILGERGFMRYDLESGGWFSNLEMLHARQRKISEGQKSK